MPAVGESVAHVSACVCMTFSPTLMLFQDALSVTIPYFPIEPPSEPAFTQTIDIVGKLNDTGYLLFFMDNSSFRANFK